MRPLVLAIALFLAGPAAAGPAGAIDWARGLVVASGGASGALDAPSARMAGVEAERVARERARERLADAARALPWAAGGTVGEALDAAGQARLDRALDRTLEIDLDYGSDGTVVARLGLPLEAVRWAVRGDAAPASQADVSALVVDAHALHLAPAVGLEVEAGGERYGGPVIFLASSRAVDGDGRLGTRRKAAQATAVTAGVVALDGVGKDDLVAARASAAPIVIVGGSP